MVRAKCLQKRATPNPSSIKKNPINVTDINEGNIVSTHKSTSHARERQDTTLDIETQKAARS